jgi:hypothetical protein
MFSARRLESALSTPGNFSQYRAAVVACQRFAALLRAAFGQAKQFALFPAKESRLP